MPGAAVRTGARRTYPCEGEKLEYLVVVQDETVLPKMLDRSSLLKWVFRERPGSTPRISAEDHHAGRGAGPGEGVRRVGD